MKLLKTSLKLVLILLWSGLTSTVSADIGGDLDKYFNELGLEGNVTAPHAYEGQRAGYYTGGSIVARREVTNLHLANIQLPSLNTGCGGIDMFMGGFSFINHDQFVAALKSILSGAKSYAFNLALESATPEIANTLKHIGDQLNQVNRFNINSCETSAALVGSVWPRTQLSQQKICADIGMSAKPHLFDDYAAARQGCGSGSKMTDTLNRSGQFANFIVNNTNIAWKALHIENSFDAQLAEFMMSLSGTIIIRTPGDGSSDKNEKVVLPSLVENSDLVAAILYGGNATIYKCDEVNKCLSPVQKGQVINIPNDIALRQRVRDILHDIAKKIVDDEPLNEKEKGLLNATNLPIYKILNVQGAYFKGADNLNLDNYAEIIAIDILFQYLRNSLLIVKTNSSALELPDEEAKRFQVGIDKALESVRHQQTTAYQKVNQMITLIQQTQFLEQQLAGQLSTEITNTLSWSRGQH